MKIKTAAIIIIGFIIVFSRFDAPAIDTPHSASNNVSCGSCHGAALLNSPFWGGSGSYDQICLSCHRASSGPYSEINAPLVKTHSSLTIDNGYGNWTRECRNCHDPHYQRQKNYKTSDSSNLYLATGTITSCIYNGDGTSTLTYSTITYKSGWDSIKLTKKTGDYRRTILFPNVNKLGYNYPVTGINEAAKTITVTGNAATYLYPPTIFAVTYGQYVKDIMDISADGSGANKTVKFFDQTGTKSYADGDGTYNGVCEVCHTLTGHYRNNGGAPDQNHANLGGGGVAGTNCITCHPHIEGFKASCNVCHGFPPPALATVPLPTGSTTAGAHVLHATTKGYQCQLCHYNSFGSGTTHNDNKITLGFVNLPGGLTGGNYDGQTSANYERSDPGTAVSKTGSKECSNLYCHGSTLAPDGGTDTTPIWDNPATGACGTCHGATAQNPPTRGSHLMHAGSANGGKQLECTACHSNYQTNHVNGGVNVQPGSGVNFTFPGDDTCSNISCHSNTDAGWGTSACLKCHSVSINNRTAITSQFNANSHHVQGITLTGVHCYRCHWEANSDGTINGTYHGGSGASGSPIDLVIYGAGTRPTTYTSGSTAIQYTANGTRSEIQKINSHCLGCHSTPNNAITPFADGKTPKQYAWDGTSVDAKYSQTGTTTWGKYTTTSNAAKKDITKSYSAHGNAQNNYGGGWPDAPSGCFGVNITQTICTEFGGTWDGACENVSPGKCSQNFCAGLTSGACGTVGGIWTGTACINISENTCTTGYCTLPREVCDEDEWGDPVCWTEYYIDVSIGQSACQSSGGAWTALNGTWKTGGKWGSGVDYALNSTRGGVNARNVACFDCHNSHGSSVSGTTTSYASATTNGGILKDTAANKGGYTMNYTPAGGGSTTTKNVYNPGAGLCFDCHMTANDGTKPWGYQSTYGATQTVMGYWDTPYFGAGTSGPQQRFAYKSSTSHKGGHFGASGTLSSPPSKTIEGICTPCHDPHGVSPTLGSNMDHSVPLLKGTWLTSPYKEDAAPAVNGTGFSNDYYHIDQNTFGSDIIPPVAGIQETDTQFAGLCLNCHSKDSLTNGTTHTWKSKDRIHESVKGWKTANGTIKHNYTCSKCHTSHNSRLPRLMATNCLNSAHKGRMTYNPSPVISGSGSDCFRYEETGGPEYYCGYGSGRMPGSYSGYGLDAPNQIVTCHENNAADQSWNVKTAWAQEIPVITSGPSAGSSIAVGSDVQATITWTTNNSYSTSYVDYGLTSGYGLTTGNDSLVRNHSIVLHNLINHSTYHYRVRSRSGAGNETVSGDHAFSISLPPTVPSLIDEPNAICAGSCSVTLQWNAATDPDGGPVQYYAEVDDASNFSSPNYNSGWISGTSWANTMGTATTWYWRVQARDANHTEAVSTWSVSDSFSISDGGTPPQVTLSSPANGSIVLSDFAMQWNAVTSPFPEYQVQYSTDSTFNTGVVSSGWITSTAWTPHPGPGTYYWRVQARDSVSQVTGPWSSSWSFTIYDGCYGDSCCLYGCDTCPTLYAWDGTKYAFETDTFPTGYLGTKTATGGWRKPNPYEYHLLDSTPQLLGGYYNLKIVEERDETDYFDTLKLYTVDYPLDRDIYQELRTAGIYVEPAQMIHTVDKILKRPLSITHVNTGEDVSAKLAYYDKDYLILNTDKNIDFNWQTLEIDLGDQSLAPQIKLIIDAETVVPTTSAGKAWKNQLSPNGKITRLEVLDANGNWTLVPYNVKEVFSPKERSNAYIVDITNIFTTGTYKFRLSFLYKVYVDAIFFDTTLDVPVTVTDLPLVSAILGYYGFSQKTEGEIFDYIYGNIVSRDTSYFIGNYTKYGDVTPLLTQTDDKFVIFAGGEELNVLFTAYSQPPAGKSRRYLVYANGYYKATGNINISHTVEPLPFAAMSNYPYDPAVQSYPTDAEHEQYLLEYNTREK